MPWTCLHTFLPANPLMSVKGGNLRNLQELQEVAQSPELQGKKKIITTPLSQSAKGPITEKVRN